MEEIKSVLKKYDIAGSIVLHTPGFSEYLHHITTSYSCAFFEGDTLRIRAKLKDFNGDKDAHTKKVGETLNMVTHIAEITGMVSLNFFKFEDMIKQHVDYEETNGGHTGHTQQNN